MKEQHCSANFKKDYLAYFAIGLFFVVVMVELYMAIWLPVYLKSQDRWAVQENRQEMLDTFDQLRRAYSRIKPATQQGKDEVAMLMDCLNNNAIYLREYEMDLNIDQIKELNEDYQTISGFLKIHRKKNKKNGKYELSLGHRRKLNPEQFLDKLRKQSTARWQKQIQQYKQNGYIE